MDLTTSICAMPEVCLCTSRVGTADTVVFAPVSITNISVSESRSLGRQDDMSPNPCSENEHLSATVTTNLNAQVAGRTLHEVKLATTLGVPRSEAFAVKTKKSG